MGVVTLRTHRNGRPDGGAGPDHRRRRGGHRPGGRRLPGPAPLGDGQCPTPPCSPPGWRCPTTVILEERALAGHEGWTHGAADAAPAGRARAPPCRSTSGAGPCSPGAPAQSRSACWSTCWPPRTSWTTHALAAAVLPSIRVAVTRGLLQPVDPEAARDAAGCRAVLPDKVAVRAVVRRVLSASVDRRRRGGRSDRPGPACSPWSASPTPTRRDTARALAAKLHELRDPARRAIRAPATGAPLLIVSQFTLYGSTAKGRRPSWTAAAPGSGRRTPGRGGGRRAAPPRRRRSYRRVRRDDGRDQRQRRAVHRPAGALTGARLGRRPSRRFDVRAPRTGHRRAGIGRSSVRRRRDRVSIPMSFPWAPQQDPR